MKSNFLTIILFAILQVAVGNNSSLKDSVFVESLSTESDVLVDTVEISDKSSIFDSLASKTGSNWITKTLYKALIRNERVMSPLHSPTLVVDPEESFQGYEGRWIRDIYILKQNISKSGATDTSANALTHTYSRLNGLHINTQSWRLKQQLHIKKGAPIDAAELADDERLLRSLPYISDVRIFIEPTFSADSVDVIIITKDAFPVNAELAMTEIGYYWGSLMHRNFLGLGMELGARLYYDIPENPQVGYGVSYANYNMWRTHSTLYFNLTETAYRKTYHYKVQKPFQTKNTLLGGAAEYLDSWAIVELSTDDTTVIKIPISNIYRNAWAGWSTVLESKVFNSVIISARLFNDNYTLRPPVSSHSYYRYHDKTMWLQSIQMRNIRYLNTSMVKSHGIIEDVPFGQTFELLAGYESAEFFSRPYFGAKLSIARYNLFKGYYAFQLAGGSFFGVDHDVEQATITTNHEYFSPLHSLGNFYYRQFVNLSIGYGVNRFPEESILAKETLPGLSSSYLRPFQSKAVLHLESYLFAPWKPAQFKFAFSLHADLAVVSSTNNIVRDYVPLQGFGFGIHVRNEHLVFQNLAFRINYYPQTELYGRHWGGMLSSSNPQRYNTVQISQPEVIPLR